MRIRVLTALCAVVFLIACGGEGKDAESSVSLLGESEADIFNETGYPIVKEPITLMCLHN